MSIQIENNRTYTNGDYKRLSDRIRNNPDNIGAEDYEMLQTLRISYKDSMATVYKTVDRLAHSIDGNCVCTYRIKRIESIISKLKRFPDMEVQRAADIAGCRCIMTTTSQAIELFEKIKKSQDKLPFEIKGTPNDYIASPKVDGYRSIHINVKLKEGARKVIEVQIRSLEHHNWATLVEISDVIFNSKLKEYGPKEHPDLYEFHQILAKSDNELSMHDYKRLTEISGDYRYLERVGKIFSANSIDLRQQRNKLKISKIEFFLISTGSDGKHQLKGFENFDEAEAAYFDWFNNNPDNRNIVLTHLQRTTFNKLSIAYSNYFLTYNSTLLRILTAISKVAVRSYNHYEIPSFIKYYRTFWFITTIWFGDKLNESDFFNKDVSIRKSVKKRNEWQSSILSSVIDVNKIVINMQKGFTTNPLYFIIKAQKKKIDKKLSRKIIYLKK